MVVHEMRDPVLYQAERPRGPRREVVPMAQADPLRTIDGLLLKREWERSRERRERRGRALLAPRAERAVRRLLEQVNQRLETCGVKIHLVLTRDESGFALDVYDCGSEGSCSRVLDLFIDLAELPDLLRRLEGEAGILVDRVVA